MTQAAAARTRAPSRARPALGGAVPMSAAMAGAGILAYVFQVLAARTLGPTRFGQVGVLWGATFLASIVLFRPLEQTASRALADRLARGEEVRSVVRSVAALVGVASVVALAAAAVFIGPLSRRLFLGDRTMTVLLAVGVAGYGAQYLARGLAAGAHWFPGYALVLLVDGGARVALALPLVVVASTHVAAAAVAGAGVAGAVAAVVPGRPRLQRLLARSDGAAFDVRRALAFAAPAAAVAGSDQLLVNGAPVLVLLEGGHDASRAAGIVFAATMLVRVPVFVFQGLAASLLPNFARLQALDSAAMGRAVRSATAVFALVGAAIVAGAAAVGPFAMRAFFGHGFDASRGGIALLALGVAFYLPAATVSQSLLAVDRVPHAARAWTVAAVAFAGIYVVAPGAQVTRVGFALAVSTLLALALLLRVAARELRPA